MGKKSSDPTDDSKTTSTTTSGFADNAYGDHILHLHYSKRPANTDDIRRRHAAPRDTASPPESVYERYADRVEGAGTEATMVFEVGGKLLKEHDERAYRREFNRAFTNAPQDAGYNNGLSAPQPDFVEGLEKGEFRPLSVGDHVPGAVLYRDDPLSVTLPHIAGEWKARGKDMEESELQSAYDGAAMVYARRQALAFMGTCSNHDIRYRRHQSQYTLEYHQYKYASTNMRDSHQGHKDGRRGLRNSQDYAKDQSYALKDQLRKHWKQQRSTVHPIAEEEPLPVPDNALGGASEEVADEDYEVVETQPVYQPTPPIAQIQAQPETRGPELTIAPRTPGPCQQTQELLDEGRHERTLSFAQLPKRPADFDKGKELHKLAETLAEQGKIEDCIHVNMDDFINGPEEAIQGAGDDLIDHIAVCFDIQDSLREEEDEEAVPRISPKEAMAAITQFIQFEEQQEETNLAGLEHLRRAQVRMNRLSLKKKAEGKQRNTDMYITQRK
ncbi:hypothetical protein OQA88_7357 [Cercophora sp. LCS_1]